MSNETLEYLKKRLAGMPSTNTIGGVALVKAIADIEVAIIHMEALKMGE